MNSGHAKIVSAYINNVREDKGINALLEALEGLGDVLVIGGAVRDILRGEKPRDIDVIACCPSVELRESMKRFSAIKNSFGGYKIEIDGIKFDIWSIDDHWPVRRGIIEKGKQYVMQGVFYNIDGVYFDLNAGMLYQGGFEEAMATRTLDIPLGNEALNDQPHAFNVIRAHKLRDQWGLAFSPKVERYIEEWIARTPDSEQVLITEAMRHFGDASFLPVGDVNKKAPSVN